MGWKLIACFITIKNHFATNDIISFYILNHSDTSVTMVQDDSNIMILKPCTKAHSLD